MSLLEPGRVFYSTVKICNPSEVLVYTYLNGFFHRNSCSWLKLLPPEEKDFNITFNIEKLKNFYEINEEEMKKHKVEDDLNQKIKVYKKSCDSGKRFIKKIVYALDFAYQYYLAKFSEEKKMENIHIQVLNIPNRIGVPLEEWMYSSILGLWGLLDFMPKEEVLIYRPSPRSQTILKLPEHFYFQPKYVEYYPDKDPSLVESYLGLDDKIYEKGQQYQWIV